MRLNSTQTDVVLERDRRRGMLSRSLLKGILLAGTGVSAAVCWTMHNSEPSRPAPIKRAAFTPPTPESDQQHVSPTVESASEYDPRSLPFTASSEQLDAFLRNPLVVQRMEDTEFTIGSPIYVHVQEIKKKADGSVNLEESKHRIVEMRYENENGEVLVINGTRRFEAYYDKDQGTPEEETFLYIVTGCEKSGDKLLNRVSVWADVLGLGERWVGGKSESTLETIEINASDLAFSTEPPDGKYSKTPIKTILGPRTAYWRRLEDVGKVPAAQIAENETPVPLPQADLELPSAGILEPLPQEIPAAQ